MRRPLFWAGIVFLSSTAAFLRFAPATACAVCAAAAALALLFSGAQPKRAALLCGCCCAAALLWLTIWNGVFGWWISPVAAGEVQLRMTVESVRESAGGYVYAGRATAAANGVSRTFYASLFSFGSLGAAPGEVVGCAAEAMPRSGALREASPRVALRYCSAAPSSANGPGLPHPWFSALLRLRANLSEAAAGLGRGDASGVLAALLAGDRSRLSPDALSWLQKSGLSHLIVVSGLHLSMLSALLLTLLSPLGRPRLISLICIASCWMFALLTGLGGSVVRAAVMLSLSQGAALAGRRGDTLTSLAAAGILMALYDPSCVVSPAFLLSFGSVSGIAALAEPIRRALVSIPGAAGRLLFIAAAPLSVAASAQLGAAPALIALYGSVSPLGVPANLAAVALVEPILLLGICGMLLGGLFAPAKILLGRMCSLLVEAVLAVARVTASLPLAQAGLTERHQAAWLVGFYLLLLALCAKRPPRGLAVRALLAVLALSLSASCLSLALRRNTVEAVLFPYQNAVAVVRGERAVLIGAPGSLADAQTVIGALSRLGVRRLDCIVTDRPELAAAPVAAVASAFGCTCFAAPDTPFVRAFCSASGMTLSQVTQPAKLLGGAVLTHADDRGFALAFGDGSVYQSQGKYVIMGENAAQLLSIGEGIARYRFRAGGLS